MYMYNSCRLNDLKLHQIYMVGYFCHHLSDNYVDLSDLYVDLSDLYVDLSLLHFLENKSCKRVQLMAYRSQQNYLASQHNI